MRFSLDFETTVPFMNLQKTEYLGGMMFDQDIGMSELVWHTL